MGLDYSYRLYFRKDAVWDVLQGVVDFAEKHEPVTRIIFPDSELDIPLGSFMSKNNSFQYDDPEISFATSLIFEDDEAILDYISMVDLWDNYLESSGQGGVKLASIGFIYLSIYQDLRDRHPQKQEVDLVLFDFGTTGTKMSMLFEYSTSIRMKFTDLLQKFNGVCGVFNREMEGEVFWLDGSPTQPYICDPWSLPDEIRQDLDL